MKTEHIEKFIEDAIAGGWKSGFLKTREITIKNGGFTLKYANEEWDGTERWTEYLKVEEALLDPEAWKAVGKTRGWSEEIDVRTDDWGNVRRDTETGLKIHNFIDHLADGKTINEALGAINN